MPPLTISDDVFDDLVSFISITYPNKLPNSLLIAQAFILQYPDHGREFGLPVVNRAIEYGINQGLY